MSNRDGAQLSGNGIPLPAVGIRLGDGGLVVCPVAVENVSVLNNTLSSGTPDIEVRCDVGSHTLSGN